MDAPRIAREIARDSPRSPWDVFGSLDNHYWGPSKKEERRLATTAFAGRQRTAVITARVDSAMLKPALESLRQLPMVTVRGWTATGDDAHILLSVSDPLPTSDLNAIFDGAPITSLEPDRGRTAAAYGLGASAEAFEAVCARPTLPEQRAAESTELELQVPIAKMNLPQVKAIDAADAHIVAVLDNGLEWNHPYVSNDVWINAAEMKGPPGSDGDGCGLIDDCIGWNFSDGSPDPSPYNSWPHGTSVAGLVMAVARSAGVPIKVMPVRTVGPANRLSLAGLAAAIDYASSHGAKTIVIASVWSLKGSPDPSGAHALAEALKRAAVRQSLVVCAAGNAGMDIVEHEIEPAYSGLAMSNVLTVLGAGPNFTTSNLAPGHVGEVVVGPAGSDVRSIGTTAMMSRPFGSTSAAAGIIGGVSAVIAAAREATGAAARKALLLQCRKPSASGSSVLSDHLFDCSFLPAAQKVRAKRSGSSPRRRAPPRVPGGSAPDPRQPGP